MSVSPAPSNQTSWSEEWGRLPRVWGLRNVRASKLARPVGDPLCAPFGRKHLTRADLEDPVDSRTGLPSLFSARRVAAVSGTCPRARSLPPRERWCC